MMLQPFPLPINGTVSAKLDFEFDASELEDASDTVASYAISSSSNMLTSGASESAGKITFFADWTGTVAEGESGWVAVDIISTSGRRLLKRMTFFAVQP